MILRNPENIQLVLACLFECGDELSDKEEHRLHRLRGVPALSVSVDRVTSRRTLSQNAMYWKWLGIFGEHIGEDPHELHEALKARLLGTRLIPGVGYVGNSTTSEDVSSFVDYMNKVHRLAYEMGCRLPQDEDEWKEWENEQPNRRQIG